MKLSAGDIVRLFDGTTTPQKQKWFLCVQTSDGWFLRINTKTHWRPHFALSCANDSILSHDCYIEMRGVIEYDNDEIEESLRVPSNFIGRLTEETIRAFVLEVMACRTLTPEEKTIISMELKAAYGI